MTNEKHMQLCFSVLMVSLSIVVAEFYPPALVEDSKERQVLDGCEYMCGDVKVPYPFGINHSRCSLEPKFTLNCTENILKIDDDVRIFHIDIVKSQIEVQFCVSKFCSDADSNSFYLSTAWLSISNKDNINKFVTIGLNSYGFLYDYDQSYSTGCVTRYFGSKSLNKVDVQDDGACTGRGCCQVDIPPKMRNIEIAAKSFNKSSKNCTYSFVVKKDNYTFHHSDLNGLSFNESRVVLDWTIETKKCSACKMNSYCYDDIEIGYGCICEPGYEGNPYHPKGCTDIDECATSNHTCQSIKHCKNLPGNYTCFCPKWQLGKGTKEGECQSVNYAIIGAGAAIMVLFVMGAFSYFIYQKRKFNKLKDKFFEQNGGFILRQKLDQRKDSSSQIAHIFKENELKKATNNYDESSIIGRGGFGTVFKGELSDNKIVAIKKSQTIDASQVEQFINEVDVVSQINHRNVVKLLGCCLETQVPLLVYEFVSNGTLSDFINKTKGGLNANNATWKTRLRIATEVAGALSYLHSSASIPIIHRDVKSDNILLDENHTAKVSDFGASRLIPLDKTEVATIVQGTVGYLDPEYMQTSQLTEKSDVYSFGVVLVELLTGEKPFCSERSPDRKSLAMHFLSCMKKDNLLQVIQDGIMNEGNKQEIKEVAILASKCLRLRGEERPCMKEVAMELEGLRLVDKQSLSNHNDLNGDETCYLLHEASSSIIYEPGDHSSKYGDTRGYDSLKDHALVVLDDHGR